MTKRRNAQAVAAWERHGGAHSPGSKKPEVDDTDEQLDQLDECMGREKFILEGTLEIDGELYTIEFDWDDEGEEDDDEE